MSVTGSPVAGSVRDRRRAQTLAEIKEAALEQLAEAGPGGFSLRGVARAVGMTVQSLYHYFDSRDALLTALVVDAHNALADAVQVAADATRGDPTVDRQLATTGAYRAWARTHRAAFLLLYGTPVPGFAPPAEAVRGAALRLAGPFLDTTFDGWTPAELAAVPLPPGAEPIPTLDRTPIPLPPGALALFIELRAQMHGLVMLELLGHLHPFQAHAGELFRGAMRRTCAELAALRESGRAAARVGR
ncbi:MAG: TetR/AcrR family transcriptional regulator [Pseudonocardia sp.]